MDYKQFASKVKAKYPEYSDMSDEDLSRRMVAKFPGEYSDVESSLRDSASNAPESEPPFSQPFFGGLFGRNDYSGLNVANVAEEIGRFAPQAIGSAKGAAMGTAAGVPFGPLGMAIGAAAGSGLGAAGGESLRGVVQDIASRYGYAPTRTTGQVFSQPAVAGAVSLGTEAGMGALQYGPGIARQVLGSRAVPTAQQTLAGLMRIRANIPMKKAEAVAGDMSLLSTAPSKEEVSAAYDAFHDASGTISRKDVIAASDDPFDMVARAKAKITEASNKLRAGTLTMQDAVEASQAARLVKDNKSNGNEMAKEIAGTAEDLKKKFDDFIQSGLEQKTKMVDVVTAQEIVPKTVNVDEYVDESILPQLEGAVEATRAARANGVYPKTLMTDAEREVYDKFTDAVENAAQHRVSISNLLSRDEMTARVPRTVEKQTFAPGKEVVEQREVVTRPELPGYAEWQRARQLAWHRGVADAFESPYPQNISGEPNVLRSSIAMGSGGAAGAAIGGSIGGAIAGWPGAAVGSMAGAPVGAAVGFASVSPAVWGVGIRAANRVAPAVRYVVRGVPEVGRTVVAPGLTEGANRLLEYYNNAR